MYAGGLIGSMYSKGKVNYCYSTSYISIGTATSGTKGGLVGYKNSNCSSTGCFWDIETSGQSTSVFGSGKTTAEMKLETTYTNEGWDFTNTWGTLNIYNDGYPYLFWETIPTVFPMPVSDWAIYLGLVLIGLFILNSIRKLF